ncbi:MAG: zinc ribbon domain-containing protein [Bryobacteraceae bacterium]|nr:zinc ribbon domain-containing protein [Bryobacteraceae bacterium]
MPLYEYLCDNCHKKFEVIQKFSDEPVQVCRLCGGGPVNKEMSAPGIHFKGSGWYVTDYAKSGGKVPASDGGKADKAEKAGTAPAAESKGETKSETKPAPAPAAAPASAPAKAD